VGFWHPSAFLTIAFASSGSDSSSGKLVFAHLLFRHGDRAPGQIYPNDPYGEKPWPQGLQELTNKGMMQHYLLGKYLRKRYSKLLGKEYSHKEIYIRSSDKNRALQSAASDLASLFPPGKNQKWNPKLDWQPMPIHSVPTDDDNLLVVDNPCPKYDQVFLNQTKAIIESYNKQYQVFFDYVKNNSGLKELDFWSIGNIYDPLYCETQHGLKLPKWVEIVVNKTTGQTAYELIVYLKRIAKNLKYYSDEKAILTGGYLLGDILTRLQKIATGGNSTKASDEDPSKMVMYSAHDDTIMALLYAMNVVEHPFLVPYAATVLIDLYQANGNQFFVEVTYKNNTPPVECKGGKCKSEESSESSEEVDNKHPESSGMIYFTIPGCPGTRCPLETFVGLLSNRTSYPKAKRDADCGIKDLHSQLRQSVIKGRL